MLTQCMMLREINHYKPKAKPMTTILQQPTSGPIPARFLATAPQPLDRAFNVAVLHIAGQLLPQGFEVSDNAPSSLLGLRAHFNATGRICVWSGGSERTIFADREVNYAFRAWHDYRHLTSNLDFTPEDEREVMFQQLIDVVRVYGHSMGWRKLLHAEIVGQGEYERANGVFPNDQMAFVRAYLADPVSALRKDF